MENKLFGLELPCFKRSDWEDAAVRALKGKAWQKLCHTNYEGIEIAPLYTEDVSLDPCDLWPDQPPFMRGYRTVERVTAGWDIRQWYDVGELQDVEKAIAADLKRGVRSLWLSINCAVDGEKETSVVSADGLRIGDVYDLSRLLHGVDLGKTEISLEAGSHILPLLAMYVTVAREKGILLKDLWGGVYADPLGILARKGLLTADLDEIWRDVALAVAWSREHAPRMRFLTVSGLAYHDAGASATQELACMLGTALDTFRELEQRDIPVNYAAELVLLQVGVGRDMFLEIAKIRALRVLWSKILAGCGLEVKTYRPVIHACTGRTTLAKFDPWVNILRSTAEVFSAAIGGADAISVWPFDRANGVPDDLGRRLAANTQLLLVQESHLAKVGDPAGGSWYIERLTEQLARKTWGILQQIEAIGGMTAALRSGYIADMIGKSAEVRHRDLARRKEPIVGVSEYANLEERAIERSRPTPAPTRRSTDMLSTEQRSMISQTADPSALFELLVDAAKKGSYVGELFAALHPEANKVFIPALPRFRWSAAWEELREASEGFKRDTGRSPLVFLVNLGDVSVYKARSEFTHRFLEAGGFEVIDNGGFEHTDAAVRAFLESGATAAVFCGSDQSYIELLARFAPVLREHKPRFLALAGRPGEHAEAWSVLGITHYIYLGCDVLATLKTFQSALGVTP